MHTILSLTDHLEVQENWRIILFLQSDLPIAVNPQPPQTLFYSLLLLYMKKQCLSFHIIYLILLGLYSSFLSVVLNMTELFFF